jgi:hypothetical protein
MSLVASSKRWNQGALARKRGERPQVFPNSRFERPSEPDLQSLADLSSLITRARNTELISLSGIMELEVR